MSDDSKGSLKAIAGFIDKLPQDAERITEAMIKNSAVSIADADGVLIFVSDKFCDMCGSSSAELLGQKHSVNECDQPADLWSTISNGKPWQGVLCNYKKCGNPCWLQTTITPLCDDHERPLYYLAVHTDVTQLKRSEQAHERRSRLLELLHRQAHSLLNADINEQRQEMRRIVDEWREAMDVDLALLLSAGKPEEPLQIHHHSHGLTDDLQRTLENLSDEQLVEELRSSECPRILQMRDPDDMGPMHRIFAAHGFQLLLEIPIGDYERRHDTIVFAWYSQDALYSIREQISLFNLLCDLISTAQQRLQNETSLKIKTDVQNGRQYLAQLGDWDMEVDSLEVSWTPGLFGLEEDKSQLSLPEFIELVHAEDRSRFLSELNRCINHHVPISFEFRIGSGVAEPTWVLMRGARMRDRARRTDKLIATLIDVTQQKQNEIALKSASAQAALASETKSKFLSAMSHELRTPLNSILGFGQLLELSDDLDADQKENVSEIISSGKHLLTLINEVLDLSLIESGRPNIILERVNVPRVIEESIAMVRTLATQQNVRLEVSGLRPVNIFVDRTRFKQCLINLLTNAIKYNRPGGRVTVRMMMSSDQKLTICVEDTGIGIDIDKQEDLFKPFERLGQDRTHREGTGIGLALTKSVVDLMDGEISFLSTPGEGSTFFLSFSVPAGELQSGETESLEHGYNLGLPAETLSSEHIVVIERGSEGTKLLKNILGEGFSGSLSSFEPGYPLQSVGARGRAKIVVVYANSTEDDSITPQLLTDVKVITGARRMIGLVNADGFSSLSHLVPYFDYICLLPIDAAKLRRTLQRTKAQIALSQVGKERP